MQHFPNKPKFIKNTQVTDKAAQKGIDKYELIHQLL